MFYVLQGEIAFRCGGGTFDLEEGGFIFCREGSSTATRYAATTQYGSWWSRVRYGMESAAAGEALSETWKRLGERSFRGVRAARLQDGPECSGFPRKAIGLARKAGKVIFAQESSAMTSRQKVGYIVNHQYSTSIRRLFYPRSINSSKEAGQQGSRE